MRVTSLPPGPALPAPLQLGQFLRRPIGFLDETSARFGDVFTLRLGLLPPAVWVADPEGVREMWSADREHGVNPGRRFLLEPLLGPRSVLLQQGAEHLRRRRLMLPPFHGERMRSYAGLIDELTVREAARWPVRTPFALLERMQGLTLDIILRAVFGTAGGAREEALRDGLSGILADSNRVRAQAGVALGWLTGRLSAAPFVRAVRRVDALIAAELAERRAARDLEERSDVLSMLLLARDEEGRPLSDGELRDQLMTLLVAGHETTATALAWAWDALFRHPDVRARLEREVAGGEGDERYLAAVVDETLRIRPVIPEVGRQLGAPLDVAGHRLARGTAVLTSVQLLHRRADLYPEPLAFRPERFLEGSPSTYGWVPFGGGMRRCLGAAFAQWEMKRVLRTLLGTVRLEPATDAPEPPRRRPVTLAPAHGTPAVVVARA